MSNLEGIIEDAVSDAALPPDTTETTPVETSTDTPDVTLDTSTTSTEAPETPISPEAPPESHSTEVASPAAKAAAAAALAAGDDFEKKYGVPAKTPDGRENRIPHTRVKSMVEKAEKSVEARFTPQIQEFETKVKDYESRLERVAQFEHIMVNDPAKFISMLKTLPQYQEALAPPTQAVVPETPVTPIDTMPQPDQEQPDGSRVYSMQGLHELAKWIKADAKAEAIKEMEAKYKPVEEDWQAREKQKQSDQYFQTVILPQIDAQMKDARTWDLFSENETEIVKVLNENPKISLERAYQTVVFPKLRSNKDDVRKQVLAELKRAPVSTSVSTGVTTKPAPAVGGKRDLEDIIREATAGLKR